MTTEKLTKEQASALIASKLELAYELIAECESIAEENKIDFKFSVAYGMGGWYMGSVNDDDENGWNPSSQNC